MILMKQNRIYILCVVRLPPELVSQNLLSLEAFSLSFDSCFCFIFCSDFTVSVFRCATAWFFSHVPRSGFHWFLLKATGQGSCFLLLYSCVSFNFYSAVQLGVGLHASIFASVLRPGFFSAVFSSRNRGCGPISIAIFLFCLESESGACFSFSTCGQALQTACADFCSHASICSPFFLRLFAHGASQSLMLVFMLPDSVWLVIFLSCVKALGLSPSGCWCCRAISRSRSSGLLFFSVARCLFWQPVLRRALCELL
jgi:hypothetical protein